MGYRSRQVRWLLPFGFLWQISPPLLGLRHPLQEHHPLPQQFTEVRNNHTLRHKLPRPTKRKTKSNLIVQQGMAVNFSEVMIVLKPFESSPPHGVLKKDWPFISGNQALMHLRKPELP